MLSLDEQLHKILSHYIGNYVTADEYESDVKEAGQAIQVLIAQQVKEARVDELNNLPSNVAELREYLPRRNAELKGDK